jgi:hypothetical protein
MSGPLALVYPVMAQVLLTLLVLLWSGRARVTALKQRRARLAEIALSNTAWPDDVRKISNNAQNQFETPTLFFVLCGAATYIGETGLPMTLLAWAYIATRLAHTFIHTTTNRVQHRFTAFATGIAVLVLMWVVVALRLVTA